MQQIIPGLYSFDEIGSAVHAYLWEWEGGVTLIDVGMPRSGATIAETLVRNGYPLHSVKRIIITHGDPDHLGSAATLKRKTGASVTSHTVERILLEHPSQRKSNSRLLNPFIRLGFSLVGTESVTPDLMVVDGQELPEGFTVVHTPGHTAGHISLLHKGRRLLIAGDALSNRGGKLALPPALFTPDMKNAQRSVWKLAKKYGDDFDVVVFGHGDPIMANGGARIKALASQIFSSEI